MKMIRVLLISFLAACAARADIPAGWSTDYDGVTADASYSGKPVLAYFTASWCGPCKMMTRTTLADPAVIKALADVPHAGVDIDAHSDIASKFGVNAVPTFIVIAPSGDEVDRTTGYQDSTDFLAWLNKAVTHARAAIDQETASKKTLSDVDQLLTSSGTDASTQAAGELFALCDQRDSATVNAAIYRLQLLAGSDPIALLDGLNDARLATRIAVANVLRAKIGDQFDIDPWSDATSRDRGVKAWRVQLAGMGGK
jgi:thioredoxin 1